MKIAWSSLADLNYWNHIAKYCVPSWHTLPGDKFLVVDDDSINFPFGKKLSWNLVGNYNSPWQKIHTNKKYKTSNFWRKMQSQVYAIRNLKDYDFIALIDSDIEVSNFNSELFFNILDRFKKSNLVWATGRSQSRLHDSGMIIFNMHNKDVYKLIQEYEDIWNTGKIKELKKSYDGHAVESMFDAWPSFKIMNTDYGRGLHVYDFGMIHYGSKEPKQLRATSTGSGHVITQDWRDNAIVKIYKGERTNNL